MRAEDFQSECSKRLCCNVAETKLCEGTAHSLHAQPSDEQIAPGQPSMTVYAWRFSE